MGVKFMKKSAKILISIAVVLAVILGTLGIHFGYAKKQGADEVYNVETGGAPLTVAVVSDLQLPDTTSEDTHQYKSAVATLTMLRDKNPDALLIAGDFTDLGTKDAWSTFEKIYNEVFGGAEAKPISLFTMGNHDYWLDYFIKCGEIATPAKMQKRFTKATGEYPFSHKTINGYHFIQWGSLDGTYDKCNSNEKWIRAEIEKAIAADPAKPVFVTTHLGPTDTVYGSEKDWGNTDIKAILNDYPQVISISAHSHFPISDERSVWQDTFTAFSTQTLDYTCVNVEQNRFNQDLTDPYGNSRSEKMPACLFMEISSDSVKIERLEANTGKTLKEPWIIEAPFGSKESLSKYTADRASANAAPTMSAAEAKVTDISDVDGNAQKMVSFAAGSDDDLVHSYKLSFLDESKNALPFSDVTYSGEVKRFDADGNRVWEGNESYDSAKPMDITELYYYSDFFLGPNNMADTVEFRLPKTMPENTKYISITAIDSWGAESEAAVCEVK